MLSNIILRSTAAFGGAPFRLKKCTALGSAGAGAGIGAATGGVPGALVGGALGVASSLLGGLFGSHNTNKTNAMNYQIMKEQNQFNAEEAKKNRDWQEMMYRMFGTSSAKANDMRAAGLNRLMYILLGLLKRNRRINRTCSIISSQTMISSITNK